MATVLERFNHLGLAHNNKILMIVGVEVGQRFIESGCDLPKKIQQNEGEFNYYVRDYPDWFIKKMDFEIINFLEHYLDQKSKVNG